MGKSASGKDSIYKMLLLKNKKLKKIAIYTTRPKRDNEEEGVEYHFVDKKYLDDRKDKLIEERVYHTVYGDWFYATLDDGNINNDEDYLMIGTLESYNKLKKYFGKEKVYPLYIEVDDKERRNRAMAREMKQKVPKIEEMDRRFREDEKDFSEENIKLANIKKRYQNVELEECVDNILKDIDKGNLKGT